MTAETAGEAIIMNRITTMSTRSTMRTSIPEGRSTRSLIPTATLALIGTVTLLSGCGRPAETAEAT